MIKAAGIAKSFGRVRAVRGVSFAVEPGQVAGLLGPNGAGKSTTIRIITGYLPADEGTVQVAGFDTRRDSLEARRNLGYLPEAAPLYPEMSVVGFLRYRARLFGIAPRDRVRAIGAAMERCRIEAVRGRRVGHLSRGYRQRVGLAAALLHDPPVLVLDEPTSALDPSQVVETRELIRDLGRTRTVLVSSHVLGEVERLCSRALIIAGGTLLADGTPAELVRRHGGPARYVIEARDEGRKAEPALRAVMGVAAVREERADGHWRRLGVEAGTDAPDLREPMAAALAGAGVAVRELSARPASLEDVFLRLLRAADPARENAA
ncbi:MAG: ABC transporter ATP-binding protein [Phycisphaeraceae bacterium]|nr:ABC transporter ATP-binding protein [Phycisphaeraceae bacterium]